ncbi:MAG: MBL fold metallo-hydrolase [Eubacterium sp.]|nr:MBL fold metallo-hydrolase [Eubacterium sp.]
MEIASICSGSSGNCILIKSGDTNVLVDVGVAKKRVLEGLDYFNTSPNEIDAILITHEHSDHVKGLGVFLRAHPVSVYATKATIENILASSSIGEVDKELFEEIDSDEEFFVGGLKVNSISTSHDASDSVCYRFDDGDKSCAVVTDLGYYHDDIVESLKDLNAILVEANHDLKMLEVGPYPYHLKSRIWSNVGHLSNEACGQLLSEIISDKMQYIILGHLSKDNNYPELAFETVRNELMFKNIDLNDLGIEIQVAKRDQPSCDIKI